MIKTAVETDWDEYWDLDEVRKRLVAALQTVEFEEGEP